MYSIMIVEDDEGIARGVSQLITAWGMEAVTVQNFRNVAGEFAQTNPQLVLMDIGLPFMNGYHWCSEIRRVSQVPIIFLSSASDNMNIIMAMNMGADDFIPKPFDGNVLIAKIQALLRRTYSFGEGSPVLEHRGAMLNTGDNSLCYRGQNISLSKNEYRILLELMKNKGKVVSREKLMEKYLEKGGKLSDSCLNCGKCEAKCPQHLKIREKLKMVEQVFAQCGITGCTL